ncbi:MAG: hypothetical protein ABIJ81_03240 [Patescibacteria group bacterium]
MKSTGKSKRQEDSPHQPINHLYRFLLILAVVVIMILTAVTIYLNFKKINQQTPNQSNLFQSTFKSFDKSLTNQPFTNSN